MVIGARAICPQALDLLERAKELQQLADTKRVSAAEAMQQAEQKEAEGLQSAKLSAAVGQQLQQTEEAAWEFHQALGRPLTRWEQRNRMLVDIIDLIRLTLKRLFWLLDVAMLLFSV